MANRRTTILGVVAGIVVVGGAAAVVVMHRHQASVTSSVFTPPGKSQTGGQSPAVGGPASAPLKMPVSGKVENGFGWQYSGTLNEWYYNPGITVSARQGSPVQAAWSGTVVSVNRQPHLGLTMTVSDGDGFRTVYGNLGKTAVHAGQLVRQGAVVGTVGGPSLYSRARGSHVDFQVYHGSTATNPMNYLHPSS